MGFRQGVGIQDVKDINVGWWTLFPPGTVFLGTLALTDASVRRGWSTPPHFQAQQWSHFNGSLGAVHVEYDMERGIFVAAKSQRQRISNMAAAKYRRQKNQGWCGITDNVPLLRSQFQCGFRGQWTWRARYEI